MFRFLLPLVLVMSICGVSSAQILPDKFTGTMTVKNIQFICIHEVVKKKVLRSKETGSDGAVITIFVIDPSTKQERFECFYYDSVTFIADVPDNQRGWALISGHIDAHNYENSGKLSIVIHHHGFEDVVGGGWSHPGHSSRGSGHVPTRRGTTSIIR